MLTTISSEKQNRKKEKTFTYNPVCKTKWVFTSLSAPPKQFIFIITICHSTPKNRLTVLNTITARNVLQSTAVLAVMLQESSGFAFGDWHFSWWRKRITACRSTVQTGKCSFFLFFNLYCLWLTDLQLHKGCVSDLLSNFIQDHIKNIKINKSNT